jgi:glycosyltransferase involved in cell wall biosynthesis
MRAELVVLNGIFSPHLFTLSKILSRRSIPFIVAPHDPYHPAMFAKRPHIKWPYWYLFERSMLRGATAIQLLDERHREWLMRLGVHQPTFAAPNGFLPHEVPPARNLAWSSSRGARLVFLGRLDAHNKGLDLLLSAFSDMRERRDLSLTLQGPDWGDRARLQHQAAQLGISDRVAFREPDYAQSSTEILSEFDVFCVPSRFEGFSLAALEAMLAGRVVLISDIAGIAPHVRESDCGVVVRADKDSVRRGLTELLERRSEWKAMGLRGRKYALEHLAWGQIAARALQRYAGFTAESESGAHVAVTTAG